jgi:hypothetical protein
MTRSERHFAVDHRKKTDVSRPIDSVTFRSWAERSTVPLAEIESPQEQWAKYLARVSGAGVRCVRKDDLEPTKADPRRLRMEQAGRTMAILRIYALHLAPTPENLAFAFCHLPFDLTRYKNR